MNAGNDSCRRMQDQRNEIDASTIPETISKCNQHKKTLAPFMVKAVRTRRKKWKSQSRTGNLMPENATSSILWKRVGQLDTHGRKAFGKRSLSRVFHQIRLYSGTVALLCSRVRSPVLRTSQNVKRFRRRLSIHLSARGLPAKWFEAHSPSPYLAPHYFCTFLQESTDAQAYLSA
jgi:hypothetical protein